MDYLKIILILGAGIAAGFINTLAGGGSLLTLPALIFAGLPAAVANGTNRIAIMVQTITAVSNFKKKGFFNLKLSLMLAIPAVLGSLLGARIAISIPDEIFNQILAVVMVIMMAIILINPTKRFGRVVENLSTKRKLTAVITFFFVGIYGGFIQAGVGFIIITSLTLITGLSLVKINSIKVFVVGVYTISSLLVFIFSGNINYIYGFILAIGNGFGAWLGSTFAIKKGDKWIRIILIITLIIMAINLMLK